MRYERRRNREGEREVKKGYRNRIREPLAKKTTSSRQLGHSVKRPVQSKHIRNAVKTNGGAVQLEGGGKGNPRV